MSNNNIEIYEMYTQEKLQVVNMMDTLKEYRNSPYLKKCNKQIDNAIRELSVIADYINQQRRIVESELKEI